MARVKGPKRGQIVIWVAVALLVAIIGAAASGATPRGRDILLATQHFMLFYSGVLALVALTAAVGAGIVATDRIVMTPGHRVVAQALHRAISFGALAFLITHIVLEILAHRSHVIDTVVPFLAQGRRFYIGLGTIASDLVVVLIITGIARGRFASRRPWTWRAIHAVAYLAWPFAILHGLLAGRRAHPYVDWSYGACVAAVALALLIRFVATIRSQREKAPHGLPDYVSSTVQAPQARVVHGAMPRPPRMPRALPPAAADRAAPPNRAPAADWPPTASRPPAPGQPPSIATRRLATPRPDLPIPQPHQQEMRPWQQREWQEQQQDVTPWQQQEWEQREWQQQQGAPALKPEAAEYPEDTEYPSHPGYPVYPAYPGAEGS